MKKNFNNTFEPPEIIILEELKLLGKFLKMSYSNNRTQELWQSFTPELGLLKNRIGKEFYSAEVYPSNYFKTFDPEKPFKKWAAVAVKNYEDVPEGMQIITIPKSNYAVFNYKGPSQNAHEIYQYIYGTWITASGFVLDNRPHFAVMGEKYKNGGASSEEEIWIPIKLKG